VVMGMADQRRVHVQQRHTAEAALEDFYGGRHGDGAAGPRCMVSFSIAFKRISAYGVSTREAFAAPAEAAGGAMRVRSARR